MDNNRRQAFKLKYKKKGKFRIISQQSNPKFVLKRFD